MLTVPVLDISQGIVVHAIQGNREKYQAIRSDICSSPDPLEVISGLLNVFNFKSLYIADLDALEQLGNNFGIIEAICRTYPNIEVWIDSGFILIEHFLLKNNLKNLRIILSSESLPSVKAYSATLNQYNHHDFILSLDYKDGHLLGTQELLQEQKQWPRDLIVLNLNSVGTEQGFQFPLELKQSEITKSFNVFYGGGIKCASEIIKLKSLGFTGALVSTALHKKSITSKDLQLINQ